MSEQQDGTTAIATAAGDATSTAVTANNDNTGNSNAAASSFPLLAEPFKLAVAPDTELAAQLTKCLNAGRVPQYPPIHLQTLTLLLRRLCSNHPIVQVDSHNSTASPTSTTDASSNPTVFFTTQQLRLLIANFLVAAAKAEGFMIQSWFLEQNNSNNAPSSSQASSSSSASAIGSLVSMLFTALVDESHSLVVGEVFRLLLQHSTAFLQAFVAHRAPTLAPPTIPAASSSSTQQQQQQQQQQQAAATEHFKSTSFGILSPYLTDTSALRNHAAWQVLLAALQPDTETLRPAREVVELLSRHVHAFIEMLIFCLRHANPACRRFALRLVQDMMQTFTDWNPISHCILQSPAVFFACLANTEGPASPEHWPCYHILKMFIMFPKKCPLMRHLCFVNRDALGNYAQISAQRFAVPPRETEMVLSKLGAMTALTAEEAALIHCSM